MNTYIHIYLSCTTPVRTCIVWCLFRVYPKFDVSSGCIQVPKPKVKTKCGVHSGWIQNQVRFRVSGFGFRVSGFGFRVSGLGFRVSGFGLRVSGFGFRVSGFGSRGSGVVQVTPPQCDRHVFRISTGG